MRGQLTTILARLRGWSGRSTENTGPDSGGTQLIITLSSDAGQPITGSSLNTVRSKGATTVEQLEGTSGRGIPIYPLPFPPPLFPLFFPLLLHPVYPISHYLFL